MNTKLFRYISFEDFINLTINNKDRFVRPSSWEDKYEGYLFSHMETTEDVHQIVSEMYYNLCPRNYYAIPDNYFRMWHSKWFTYAQCRAVDKPPFGRSIQKQMPCGGVIHMEIGQFE